MQFFFILEIKYWKNTFETKKKLKNKMHKLNTKTSLICSMISPYEIYNSKIICCAFNCAEYVVMEKKESYSIFVWTIIIVCFCSSKLIVFVFLFEFCVYFGFCGAAYTNSSKVVWYVPLCTLNISYAIYVCVCVCAFFFTHNLLFIYWAVYSFAHAYVICK